MKKMCIFGMVAVWLLNMLPVKANNTVQVGSAFYTEHAEECMSNDREYSTVGPDGKVEVYVSPEDATVVDSLPNGTDVAVPFTYIDSEGNMWGLVENAEDAEKTGWVKMIYMRLIQKSLPLEREFMSLVEEKSGVLDDEYLGSTIIFWNYPSVGDLLHAALEENGELPQYSKVFVDELGYTWGYVDSFGGVTDKWICLDNPTASVAELYPEGAPDRGVDAIPKDKGDLSVATTGSEEPVQATLEETVPAEKSNTGVFIVCGVIAAAVAVTGGLLVWFKKR